MLFWVILCCLCLSGHKVSEFKLLLLDESEVENQIGPLWSNRLS